MIRSSTLLCSKGLPGRTVARSRSARASVTAAAVTTAGAAAVAELSAAAVTFGSSRTRSAPVATAALALADGTNRISGAARVFRTTAPLLAPRNIENDNQTTPPTRKKIVRRKIIRRVPRRKDAASGKPKESQKAQSVETPVAQVAAPKEPVGVAATVPASVVAAAFTGDLEELTGESGRAATTPEKTQPEPTGAPTPTATSVLAAEEAEVPVDVLEDAEADENEEEEDEETPQQPVGASPTTTTPAATPIPVVAEGTQAADAEESDEAEEDTETDEEGEEGEEPPEAPAAADTEAEVEIDEGDGESDEDEGSKEEEEDDDSSGDDEPSPPAAANATPVTSVRAQTPAQQQQQQSPQTPPSVLPDPLAAFSAIAHKELVEKAINDAVASMFAAAKHRSDSKEEGEKKEEDGAAAKPPAAPKLSHPADAPKPPLSSAAAPPRSSSPPSPAPAVPAPSAALATLAEELRQLSRRVADMDRRAAAAATAAAAEAAEAATAPLLGQLRQQTEAAAADAVQVRSAQKRLAEAVAALERKTGESAAAQSSLEELVRELLRRVDRAAEAAERHRAQAEEQTRSLVQQLGATHTTRLAETRRALEEELEARWEAHTESQAQQQQQQLEQLREEWRREKEEKRERERREAMTVADTDALVEQEREIIRERIVRSLDLDIQRLVAESLTREIRTAITGALRKSEEEAARRQAGSGGDRDRDGLTSGKAAALESQMGTLRRSLAQIESDVFSLQRILPLLQEQRAALGGARRRQDEREGDAVAEHGGVPPRPSAADRVVEAVAVAREALTPRPPVSQHAKTPKSGPAGTAANHAKRRAEAEAEAAKQEKGEEEEEAEGPAQEPAETEESAMARLIRDGALHTQRIIVRGLPPHMGAREVTSVCHRILRDSDGGVFSCVAKRMPVSALPPPGAAGSPGARRVSFASQETQAGGGGGGEAGGLDYLVGLMKRDEQQQQQQGGGEEETERVFEVTFESSEDATAVLRMIGRVGIRGAAKGGSGQRHGAEIFRLSAEPVLSAEVRAAYARLAARDGAGAKQDEDEGEGNGQEEEEEEETHTRAPQQRRPAGASTARSGGLNRTATGRYPHTTKHR